MMAAKLFIVCGVKRDFILFQMAEDDPRFGSDDYELRGRVERIIETSCRDHELSYYIVETDALVQYKVFADWSASLVQEVK